ncbi:hypothetical protein PSPO01_07273 [Paraphaeosphaeria sporulosa]
MQDQNATRWRRKGLASTGSPAISGSVLLDVGTHGRRTLGQRRLDWSVPFCNCVIVYSSRRQRADRHRINCGRAPREAACRATPDKTCPRYGQRQTEAAGQQHLASLLTDRGRGRCAGEWPVARARGRRLDVVLRHLAARGLGPAIAERWASACFAASLVGTPTRRHPRALRFRSSYSPYGREFLKDLAHILRAASREKLRLLTSTDWSRRRAYPLYTLGFCRSAHSCCSGTWTPDQPPYARKATACVTTNTGDTVHFQVWIPTAAQATPGPTVEGTIHEKGLQLAFTFTHEASAAASASPRRNTS